MENFLCRLFHTIKININISYQFQCEFLNLYFLKKILSFNNFIYLPDQQNVSINSSRPFLSSYIKLVIHKRIDDLQ